jgi:hypothetical protein
MNINEEMTEMSEEDDETSIQQSFNYYLNDGTIQAPSVQRDTNPVVTRKTSLAPTPNMGNAQ